jgi:hypothetical protein
MNLKFYDSQDYNGFIKFVDYSCLVITSTDDKNSWFLDNPPTATEIVENNKLLKQENCTSVICAAFLRVWRSCCKVRGCRT